MPSTTKWKSALLQRIAKIIFDSFRRMKSVKICVNLWINFKNYTYKRRVQLQLDLIGWESLAVLGQLGVCVKHQFGEH